RVPDPAAGGRADREAPARKPRLGQWRGDPGQPRRVRCRRRRPASLAVLPVGSPSTVSESTSATYAAAGVSIDAGDQAVELLKPHAARATRPEVMGGVGGFAGLFSLKLDKWKEPVLASSTDGVGTKIAVAQALDKHDTVGIDLVAMVVDDLVVTGAEPLFLQDYIAVGKVHP